MATVAHNEGYSAVVELRLEMDGQTFSVAQVRESSFMLSVPQDLPEGSARIVVVVDGEEFNYDVYLFEGASRNCERVHFF